MGITAQLSHINAFLGVRNEAFFLTGGSKGASI